MTYDRVLRVFHWTMAVIVIAAMVLGTLAAFLVPGTPLRKALLDVHKSLGLTAALLILPRTTYRLLSKAPRPIDDVGHLTRVGAAVAHAVLYALMFFMPVTGYMFSAAGGYSLPWFGLFQWPRMLDLNAVTASLGEWLHDRGAWLTYAVVCLHIAAVGWHHFYRKDAVLSRMLGPRKPKDALPQSVAPGVRRDPSPN